MLDKLLTLPQHLLPQHLLSRGAKRLSHIKQPRIKNILIKGFLNLYDVNLNEASKESIDDYEHFNAFFTRKLKENARPLADNGEAIVCPADGLLSQYHQIDDCNLIQAKGRTFKISDLLARPASEVNHFSNGFSATIYLAPNDYHRVHAPFDGKVVSATYVPGRLFSVNQRTAQHVDNLFARNERVIVEMQTNGFGRIMIVLVGALLVASIGLEFFDLDQAIYAQNIRRMTPLELGHSATELKRGDPLGWFNMGSTVVLVFENGCFDTDSAMTSGKKVKMGEQLGRVVRQC